MRKDQSKSQPQEEVTYTEGPVGMWVIELIGIALWIAGLSRYYL